jgi:hypothetical protein
VTSAPAAPAPPPLDVARMDRLLQAAYRAQLDGNTAAAQEAFHDAVKLAQASGAPLSPGPGDLQGTMVPARGGIAALEMTGGAGHPVLFFDAGSGEPLSFEPDLPSFADEPVLPDPPLFLVEDADQEQALFDPKTRDRLVEGARVLVRPGGQIAYTFREDDCRWHVWDLRTRKEAQALTSGVRPGGSCDASARRASAFISVNGRFLVDGAGLWDLKTSTFTRIGGAGSDGYSVLGSPDRRYVAYVSTIPGASASTMGAYHHLHVVDLVTGNKTRTAQPLHFLSNGAPLSFGQDPLRLCVFDFSRWAFEVPSLRMLARFPRERSAREEDDAEDDEQAAKEETLLDCRRPLSPPTVTTAEAELRARLALRVCHIAGRLVPRAICEPPGASQTAPGATGAP